MKKKLSVAFIRDILPAKKKQTVHDSVTQYLALVVIPSGTKTFYYCRRIAGKLKYIRIGKADEISLDQAREQSMEISRRIAAGLPLCDDESEQKATSLREIWEEYIRMREVRGDRERSLNISRRRFDLHFPADLADLPADKVQKKRLQDVIFQIGENSGKRNATLLAIDLRAAYNYARKIGTFSGDNPASGLVLFANVERKRFLLPEEAARFFAALRQAENENFRDFVMLAILTGKRKNEILRLQWGHVDLAGRMLSLPRENMKNDKPDLAVLDAAAVEILERRKKAAEARHDRSCWVFSADTPCGHYSSPEKAFRALLTRANIPDFRIHDLRRTLGSYMAANGESLHMIASALGQSSTAATHIYARVPSAAKRAAVSGAVAAISRMAELRRDPRDLLDQLLDARPDLVEPALAAVRKLAEKSTGSDFCPPQNLAAGL